MWAWCFVALVGAVALVWAWLQLSGRYRNNLDQRIEPVEPIGPAADDATASAGLSLPPNASPPDESLPGVIIFCPGRNEAEHLPTTLPQLCEQDYPKYRVVFIDDHSDDDTPRITAQLQERYPHLIVFRNEAEPPADWVGKCWAIKRGYDAIMSGDASASGDVGSLSRKRLAPDLVCFTDADVHWHPQCLRRAVEAMNERDADIVSLFPGMEFGTAVERLTIATLALALNALFPVERALDPDDPEALVAGAFALVKRDLYESIGGHEAVKNCVVEDINLGRRLKAAGGRLWFAHTHRLIHCRMYNGWSDLWEGLTKNAYAGLEYSPLRAAGLVVACVLGTVLPPVYFVGSAIGWALGGGAPAAVAAGLALAALLLQARAMNRVRKTLDLPARYAFSTPVGTAIYLVLMVASVWRYYRGGNVWKGRSYGRAVTAPVESS